jgi:hypothetical protein
MSELSITIGLGLAVAAFGWLIYRVVSTLPAVRDFAKRPAKGGAELPVESFQREAQLGRTKERPNAVVPFQ